MSSFDDDVIHVGLHCLADLFLEACLDHALVGGAGVLEPERQVLTQNGMYGVMNAVAA